MWVQTDVLQCYPIGRLRIKHLSALKTAEYNGNDKRFEYGERRDAAGCLGTKKCGKKNCGSGRDAQATLCRRAFPYGKEVCERLYISPRTLQDYRDRRIIPYTQFAGKILYKASDLEKMLEANYSRIKTVDVLLKRKWH